MDFTTTLSGNEDIERVSTAIARHVTDFVRSHRDFHGEELRQYVFDHVDGYVSPGSPDRILRDLRQKGVISYQLVSRSRSLYRSLGQGELF